MHGDKLKKGINDVVMNFLIDDYSSWNILELSNFKWQKSRDDKKKGYSLLFSWKIMGENKLGKIKHPLSIFPVNKELEPQDLKLIQNQLRELDCID